jgi:YrbI family 3-deoxy-D-manno-octulosonate 8-phosphate phosphatase
MNNIISHRGNIDGVNTKLENHPEYILAATKEFSVEVDVWLKAGKFYLGHDEPLYLIDKLFLFSDSIISHCKNIECFYELRKFSMVESFFQELDAVALTTKGNFIFHSSSNPIDYKSTDIIVNLEKPEKKWLDLSGSVRILTDYPTHYDKKSMQDDLFDLLVIDIDGVMTDGTKIYSTQGDVTGKCFSDKDFTAIKRFKNAGISVCFLSGDKSVNEAMALDRAVDFYFARLANGNIDKSVFVRELKEKYRANKIAYVGDDYYDITIMESVDFSFAPQDAIEDVKNVACKVLTTKGGCGVIAEIYELYKNRIPQSFAYDTYK